MNRVELINQLNILGINPNQYSLFGDLLPDAVILFQNYDKWEVFYYDERGNRNDERIYKSENEACTFILNIFMDSKFIEEKFKLNT